VTITVAAAAPAAVVIIITEPQAKPAAPVITVAILGRSGERPSGQDDEARCQY
jgi:hypothetical protein